MSLPPSQWNYTETQVSAKPGSYLYKLLRKMMWALLPKKHHLKCKLSKIDIQLMQKPLLPQHLL